MVLPPPALSSNFQDLLSKVKASYSLTEPAASAVAASLFELEMEKKMIEFEKKVISIEAQLKVAQHELDVEKKVSILERRAADSQVKLTILSEESALQHLARISAILANRCLMESALNKWDSKNGIRAQRTIRAQYNDFLHTKILSGSWETGSFLVDSMDLHNQINSFSAVSASEQDVRNELEDLPITLSSYMHYSTKPLIGAPGCYMGGGLSPFYNALGICIAVLKKEGCCPETIYLADSSLKPFARIDGVGIGGYLISCTLAIIPVSCACSRADP
jgi:hypothetical protein